MAYISYNKLWESKFDDFVSKKDKVQDLNINQLKFELHDTYQKDEKTLTNFEAVNDEDVINQAHLVGELFKKMVIYYFKKRVTTNLNYNTTNSL